jgi:ATP-binding cassette subfamily F protein 3
VEKPISVLSGGERARLCLGGLLLSNHNILILDEPGNHLDVDTVDSLAEALIDYQGTVIFTSHDRHFARRVATSVVEVRDGRVTHHSGPYNSYLDKVNKEIEAGERELAAARAKLPATVKKAPVAKPVGRSEKEIRKEMKAVEKTIATLDEQKKTLSSQSLESTDAVESLRLHNELAAVSTQLSEAEEKWLRLQDELDAVE